MFTLRIPVKIMHHFLCKNKARDRSHALRHSFLSDNGFQIIRDLFFSRHRHDLGGYFVSLRLGPLRDGLAHLQDGYSRYGELVSRTHSADIL